MSNREKKSVTKQDLDQDDSVSLTKERSAVRLVKRILSEAVERRANDILIEPVENECCVRLRIDGVLYKFSSFPFSFHQGLISRIKVISNLDIAEHRLPQDGRFRLSLKDKEVDFRVSIVPSTLGEKAALRALDKATVILDIDKLGFDRYSLQILKRNLIQPYGMIIVCGPTGCGKTTTLYAALKYLDSVEKNIIAVEDPIEYQLEGINQIAVQEEVGLTFAHTLRSILRQDPDIILVGEIRDFETADTAIKAGLTGHLVLSTLHTTTTTGSLIRLINMGIEPYLITSSCLLVASQALLRLLCPHCKQSYPMEKAMLEEMRLCSLKVTPDTLLYRPGGCSACDNFGYRGRMGIIELLEINETLRDMINARASERDIRGAARKAGMRTLRENGLACVLNGLTSIAEVLRATPADESLNA